jgi:ribosome-associated translation inhibitor RaiA
MRGEPGSMHGGAFAPSVEPGATRIVVVGAVDELTAAYIKEKLHQVSRATGRQIARAEVQISPLDEAGDVLVDLTIEVGRLAVRSRVAASSAMSALDRFESQLRRRLAPDEEGPVVEPAAPEVAAGL